MDRMPLLVHLLFHPKSESALVLARLIHNYLNDDAVISGLRIPTVFCPQSVQEQPPLKHRLELAERSFVVILADDHLTVDAEWSSFVADVWVDCQSSPHRCVPIQLSRNAWPLDDRLRGVSFARAHLQLSPKSVISFTLRTVVVELCRYLLNFEIRDTPKLAPVKLFLSHTKLDMDVEPRVAEQFIQHLGVEQPVEAWVDSGRIPTGSEFAEAIGVGVKRTSLLVLLTDNYSTREWCREEVMLAKEHQRPIAVVDALSTHEARSFPFLVNVPRLRWNGDPQAGIDLLLKETLRCLHTGLLLNRYEREVDQIFVRPPEPCMLLGLPAGSTVLYPDPPLGAGESRRLAKSRVKLTTRLQRQACGPSLRGNLIAMSMSESTDIHEFGMDPVHLEDTILNISRYLLLKGASLAYGGHLGVEGFTQKLFELVRSNNDLEGVEPFERIVNFRGWPLPRLEVSALAELNRVSRTHECPRPSDVTETMHPDFLEKPRFFSGDKSALHRYAWARGMTEMRRHQCDPKASGVAARVVIGGTFGPTVKVLDDGTQQKNWYASRIPGVLEEIIHSVEFGQPVFLIGAFGGVAKLVIDLIQNKTRVEASWDYQKQAPFASELRQFYEGFGNPWLDYPELVTILQAKGMHGINPLLTEADSIELSETVDNERMIELILTGLWKMRKSSV